MSWWRVMRAMRLTLSWMRVGEAQSQRQTQTQSQRKQIEALDSSSSGVCACLCESKLVSVPEWQKVTKCFIMLSICYLKYKSLLLTGEAGRDDIPEFNKAKNLKWQSKKKLSTCATMERLPPRAFWSIRTSGLFLPPFPQRNNRRSCQANSSLCVAAWCYQTPQCYCGRNGAVCWSVILHVYPCLAKNQVVLEPTNKSGDGCKHHEFK